MQPISEKLTINLNIAGKYYPITIRRDMEENYRKAAKLISQKYNSYVSNYQTGDPNDYFAMTMLDLALSVVREEKLDNKLEELIAKINEAMK